MLTPNESREGLVILGRAGINGQPDAPTVHTIFVVPPGKKALIAHVAIHSNSASLAGMTDVNFGGGPAGITPVWKDAADLSSMTTVNDYLVVWPDSPVEMLVAGAAFVAEVVSGSTAASTVMIDVLGYLVDA